MHEFDIEGDGQTDAAGYAEQLHGQVERLGSGEVVIGAEGDGEAADQQRASGAAHDLAATVDTEVIGNGHDVIASDADAEPDADGTPAADDAGAAEPADSAPEPDTVNEGEAEPDTQERKTTAQAAHVAAGVAPLAVESTTEADAEPVAAVVADAPAYADATGEPEPVTDTPAAPAAVTDAAAETSSEFGDTSLPPEEIFETQARWERGEVVESKSMAVDRVEISDAELAALRDKQPTPAADYAVFGGPDLNPDSPMFQRYTGLDREQLTLLREVDDRFMDMVRADMARNGYVGDIVESQHDVEIGTFDPDSGTIRWHVDNAGNPPTVRYVMSIGEVGTRFAHGPTQKSDVDLHTSYVTAPIDTGPNGSHEEVTYDSGVLVRFTTSTGIHQTPGRGGFRIFFSVPVRLAEEEQRDRR